MKRKWHLFCARFAIAGFLLLPGGSASAASLPECTTDSSKTPLTFISAVPCGSPFQFVTTRPDNQVWYMVHQPAADPKAVVVLFTGGNGNAIASRNFLVRSAQLFAERGYRAVTINRPILGGDANNPEFPGGNAAFDQYRVSPYHADDIGAVLAAVNTDGLSVLFAGTSRGTLSALAQRALSVGISLSSPVTSPSGTNLYIGHPDHSNLQPNSSITVPVRLLAHESDGCFVTTPEKAVKLHVAFKQAGWDSHYNSIDGGFDLAGQTVDGVLIDACDSVTYHGYLGIENEAVDHITKRFDKILKGLNN
jgi:hypothetical protein